jgi:hypothetical protein
LRAALARECEDSAARYLRWYALRGALKEKVCFIGARFVSNGVPICCVSRASRAHGFSFSLRRVGAGSVK